MLEPKDATSNCVSTLCGSLDPGMPPSRTSPLENLLQGIDDCVGPLITNPSHNSPHAFYTLTALQDLEWISTHESSFPLLKRNNRIIIFVPHLLILSIVWMVQDQFSLPKEKSEHTWSTNLLHLILHGTSCSCGPRCPSNGPCWWTAFFLQSHRVCSSLEHTSQNREFLLKWELHQSAAGDNTSDLFSSSCVLVQHSLANLGAKSHFPASWTEKNDSRNSALPGRS